MRSLLLLALLSSCAAAPPTEVVVLGMIHGSHRTSEVYGLDTLEAILRESRPDVVLTEIPPDRLARAAAEFAKDGTIEEPRVVRFPEYVDVLFPLQAELGFEIVPCAAWTSVMASARSEALRGFSETRPDDTAAMQAGFASVDERLAELGDPEDPRLIHTDRYDAFVTDGMRPYDELFNDDLGPGGWTNINDAHWALCAEALDGLAGTGKRAVITFGAWHKAPFRERLALRDDVKELDAGAIVEAALEGTGALD